MMYVDFKKKVHDSRIQEFPKPKQGKGLMNNVPQVPQSEGSSEAQSKPKTPRHTSSLAKKSATTNDMKVWRGSGTKYPLNLDEKDQNLILEGIKLKKPITLKLDYNQLIRTKEGAMNDTYLPLSEYQIKKIEKAKKKKTSVILEMKAPQLKYIKDHNKEGGFLPALMAALPAALPVITALSSVAKDIYTGYSNKKANDKLVEEGLKKINAIKENVGYGLQPSGAHNITEFLEHYKNVQVAEKKLGKGFYVNSKRSRNKEIEGKGFYVNAKKKN